MRIKDKMRVLWHAFKIYKYDFINELRYANNYHMDDSQEKLLSKIVVEYHTIEKGLTMPNIRLGFGKDKLNSIVKLLRQYESNGYDVLEKRFVDCVGVIKEYVILHDLHNYKLDADTDNCLRSLLHNYKNVDPVMQIHINKNEYFSYSSAPFDKFSYSRHSVRNYCGPVDELSLQKALHLAMNAPSTCNRQSIRIHIFKSKESKDVILKIQSGNRGFGNLADQFILITSDLSSWPGQHQRNAPYVDGGIFVMNLLYCLHFYHIGACTLNMYLNVERDIRLKRELGIPPQEVPIALISIGKLPKEFDIARSTRRELEEILTIH